MPSRSINICIILLAGTIAFMSATLAGFLSIDDAGMISSITSSGYRYRDLFLGGLNQYYRPLVVLSYSANATLSGLAPFGFHLVNVIVHLLNSLLVYYLAVRFLPEHPEGNSTERFALVAALLFLLHPVNSEAVVWVSARPDLLCTFFFLLGLILLVTHRHESSPRSLVFLFLTSLASFCSKEAAISMAAIAPGYLLLDRRGAKTRRNGALLTAAVFAATLLYLFLRSGGFHGTVDKGIRSVVANVATGVVTQTTKSHPSLFDAVGAYGFYLSKLVVPFPLNFTIVDFHRGAAYSGLGAAIVCSYFLLRRDRAFLLPLLIIFAGIIPPIMAYVANLPWTPLGERYLYLPMVGFSLLVPLVLMRLKKMPTVVPVVLALMLAIPTMSRVGLWCDAKAFWNDALRKSPTFAKNYSALGGLFLDEGNYDEAERHMLKAVSLGYGDPVIWQNLGRVYAHRKDYDQYEAAMNKAASRSPTPSAIYVEMVSRFMTARKSGDQYWGYRKAIEYSGKALEKDPHYLEANYNIGKMYLHMGERDQARRFLTLYADTAKNGQFRPFALKMIRKIQPDGGAGETRLARNSDDSATKGSCTK